MNSTKHVVITGASSGFGWAMTERFLRKGWTVHATCRKGEIAMSESLPASDRSRLHVYALDLTVESSRKTFVQKLLTGTRSVDVLINNAGFGLFGALEDLSEAQIRRQVEVNFIGATLITQSLLPSLRAARGHIINLSSVLGYSGLPLTSLYCASKFALEGWSEALKYELSSFGVKVTVVQPGAHRTKFGPNVEWGERSFAADSAFIQSSRNYKRLLEKMMNRPNPSRPENVADGVCAIAGTAHPPFRLRFGKDAQATYWARRLMPFGVMLKLFDRVYRRILLAPARG